jgi:hypothetical protein
MQLHQRVLFRKHPLETHTTKGFHPSGIPLAGRTRGTSACFQHASHPSDSAAYAEKS